MDPDNEAPRDPRAITSWSSCADTDFEGHRALSVYIGFHVPSYRLKGHHKHRHHHHHHRKSKEFSQPVEFNHDMGIPGTPPLERVRFILGGDEDETNEPHPVFSEMEELHKEGPEIEWRETARWVKFEEDVDIGGDRWSKPHIATVSLHSLLVLRSCILNGTVELDMEASNLEDIADEVLSRMISIGQLQEDQRDSVKNILLCKHHHQHGKRAEWVEKSTNLPLTRSQAEAAPAISVSVEIPKPTINKKSYASTSMPGCSGNEDFSQTFCYHPSGSDLNSQSAPAIDQSHPDFFHWVGKSLPSFDKMQLRQGLMRKVPPDAHASNILVGELDFLDRYVAAFVRLSQARPLGDLTEIPIPTKFLFIILGPPSNTGAYHEVGRAFATLMSDEVFHDVAYKGRTRQDLLAGIDEFMDAATVLPAGVWDPTIRMEPLKIVISKESRRKSEFKEMLLSCCDDDDHDNSRDDGLRRTGRLFGGLVKDIQRKAPWYWTDFMDFFAVQSIASVVFLYIACLAPIITFGGMLGDATKHRMGAMENLMSALICGVVYALFSGQPLTILGTTGGLLVYEGTIFNYCEWWDIEYLPFRLWIGFWTSCILFLFVAFDASVLVCYITRFTEEIFSTLISTIFIFKAFENVLAIEKSHPMKIRTTMQSPLCGCYLTTYKDNLQFLNFSYVTPEECTNSNGSYVPESCNYTNIHYVPNVFLFSIILFAGTFAITSLLRKIKASPFFPTKVRIFISDFAVIIAMVSMSAFDYYIAIGTPKLTVPQEFKPTWVERSWLVPFFGKNPWWTVIIAILPALVATVLIFIDQQITAVIVNRKENMLKKGCGYHLDLFVLAVLIAVCSVFGLPWSVAATMLSMTHVTSLKKVAQCSAPGEKPQFLGVREQRGTQICIFILVGLSIFFTPVLKHIPMPVLYGIFLYMGVISLKGIQFIKRVLMLFMPQKYQPDYTLLRHVPIRIVHCFTAIEIVALLILFVIKYFPESALCFPAVLIVVIFIRRKCLIHIFNDLHLRILDGDMPISNESDPSAVGKMFQVPTTGTVDDSAENKQLTKAPFEKYGFDRFTLSITELLTQSSVWKCIDQQSQKTPPLHQKLSHSSLKKRKIDPKIISDTDEGVSSRVSWKKKGNASSAQTSLSVPEHLCNYKVNEAFNGNEAFV